MGLEREEGGEGKARGGGGGRGEGEDGAAGTTGGGEDLTVMLGEGSEEAEGGSTTRDFRVLTRGGTTELATSGRDSFRKLKGRKGGLGLLKGSKGCKTRRREGRTMHRTR